MNICDMEVNSTIFQFMLISFSEESKYNVQNANTTNKKLTKNAKILCKL